MLLKNIKPIRTNAKDLIKEIEYQFQADRTKIVKATKLIKKATTEAYTLTYELNNNPDFIDTTIGREFTGNINIESDSLTIFQKDLKWLDKELENIEFLEDNELANVQNIQKYKNQAKKIKSNEQIIISASKIKETQYEQSMPLPQVIMEDNTISKMKLVPGIYKVNIQFQDLGGI